MSFRLSITNATNTGFTSGSDITHQCCSFVKGSTYRNSELKISYNPSSYSSKNSNLTLYFKEVMKLGIEFEWDEKAGTVSFSI